MNHLPESIFNMDERVLATRIETNVPNILLEVRTTHHRKSYINRIERLKVEGPFVSMMIGANRFRDPAPVSDQMVPTGRYSVKELRAQHENLRERVLDHLEECIEWAERYGG